MISVIAFDYGGVIEIYKTDLIKEITDMLAIDKDTWFRAYFASNYLFNTDENTWEGVVSLVAKELGASESQLARIQEIAESNKTNRMINTELIDRIAEFKKQYKIAIISNYTKELRERLASQNILDLFDEIVISGEVGYQKPQPEIFAILCERLNIPMSELVFIDDTEQSLKNATQIGYTPILYVDNKQLDEDLAKILKKEQSSS